MKRIRVIIAIATVLMVIGLVYAKEVKKAVEKKSQGTEKKDSKEASAGSQEDKNSTEVIVDVNGKKITLGDFNRMWNEIPEQSKYMITKEKFLDSLIQTELIVQESLKSGLDKTESYKKSLEDVKKQLLANEYLNNEIVEKIKVTDADIKDYYDNNKSEFMESEKVNAKHILVKTEEEAKEITKLLSVNKGDFEKLAKEKSIDTVSGQNGGDLGNFGHNEMVPEFEKTAFSLKEGEISEPVKTQYGYHIIMGGKITPSKQKEFSEVKEQLDKTLLRKKQRDKFEQIITELKSKSKIVEKKELLK